MTTRVLSWTILILYNVFSAYMACYYDTVDRLLDGDFLDDPSNLTNEKCVQYCRDRGFSYAGTQVGFYFI